MGSEMCIRDRGNTFLWPIAEPADPSRSSDPAGLQHASSCLGTAKLTVPALGRRKPGLKSLMQSREQSLDVRNAVPNAHAVADPSAACSVCAVRSAAANVSTASSGSRRSSSVADFMCGRRTTSSVVHSVRALSHTSAQHVTSGLCRVCGRRTDASDVRQALCCLSPVTPRSPRRRPTHALVIGQPRLTAGAGPCGASGVARQYRVATRTSTEHFCCSCREQQKCSVEVLVATRCWRVMPARISS